ncbi:MAG: hypothetical protein ACHP9T_00385 [Caulobacterales bacterium]|jgi:hypothetical protein
MALAVSTTPSRPANAARSQAVAAIASTWRFPQRDAVAVLQTPYAPVVYLVPRRPQHILVLAFGYPWDDVPDAKILAYAQANVRAWSRFAQQDHVMIVAPVLGGSNFLDFRTLSGRLIDPDTFVNALVDGPARRAMPDSDGKFCIHGHSAGAQFVARYVVANPNRIECAILSAPSTYAMPTLSLAWPFGMAPARDARGRSAPSERSWTAAATGAPIDVLVGSRDVETRPPAPGQTGASRLDRGRAWVKGMQALAAAHHQPSSVRFIEVPGVDHNEPRMAIAAQTLLRGIYLNK